MIKFKLVWRRIRLWFARPRLLWRLSLNARHKRQIEARVKKRAEEKAARLQLKGNVGKKNIPPYLAKNKWEEELNFKLWTTKGARFQAARRCEDKDTSSQWAVALLTSYLIILGLIPFVPNEKLKQIPPDLVSFGTTGVSILLLAYSLLVTARGYALQAHKFHECALKLGVLYNGLRRAKECPDETEKAAEIKRISEEYDGVLSNYPNHQPIDYDYFQTYKAEYFYLSGLRCFWIRRSYYLHTKGLFHLIIALPVFLFIIATAYSISK